MVVRDWSALSVWGEPGLKRSVRGGRGRDEAGDRRGSASQIGMSGDKVGVSGQMGAV